MARRRTSRCRAQRRLVRQPPRLDRRRRAGRRPTASEPIARRSAGSPRSAGALGRGPGPSPEPLGEEDHAATRGDVGRDRRQAPKPGMPPRSPRLPRACSRRGAARNRSRSRSDRRGHAAGHRPAAAHAEPGSVSAPSPAPSPAESEARGSILGIGMSLDRLGHRRRGRDPDEGAARRPRPRAGPERADAVGDRAPAPAGLLRARGRQLRGRRSGCR